VPNLDSLERILNNKLTYGISFAALGVLIAINLIGTNALATQGFAVNDLEIKTLELESENEQLKVKIEEIANLKETSALAKTRGFLKARDIVFMPTPPTTALR